MIIRNFLFHRVSPETEAMWPPMKPELFTRIIKQLVRDFTVVPLEHYLNDPKSVVTKKKMATVLFDDGYKDNIEYAAPILKELNCPASFYVVTDCINKNIPTWTYILDNFLTKTRAEKIEFPFDFVPEKFKSVQTKINKKLNPVINELKPWMKKLSNPQRLLILQSLTDQCRDVQTPEKKMMNWDDVRQLQSDGFIIGSHSHTHPCLSSLTDIAEIKDELNLSREKIRAETGQSPQTISYPMNDYDERVMRVAKEEGYEYGLAVGERFYTVGKYDIYSIPRSELHQEPWWKVQIRIRGVYTGIKKVWA